MEVLLSNFKIVNEFRRQDVVANQGRLMTGSTHVLEKKKPKEQKQTSGNNVKPSESQLSQMYDSNGNIMSKTQILRKLYYERQLNQMAGIRNGLLQNVSVDKNLQKVLEYIS